MDPCGKADRPMRIGTLVLLAIGALFAGSGGNRALDLMAFHDPAFHKALAVWHYAAPGIATLLASSLVLSVWRVWLRPRRRSARRDRLPAWPVSPTDPAPSVVVGELHHPTGLAGRSRGRLDRGRGGRVDARADRGGPPRCGVRTSRTWRFLTARVTRFGGSDDWAWAVKGSKDTVIRPNSLLTTERSSLTVGATKWTPIVPAGMVGQNERVGR